MSSTDPADIVAPLFRSSKASRRSLTRLRGLQNVIQGVYPSKPAVRDDIGPEPVSIMGNEGVATVEGFEEDGNVEHKLKVGDRGAPTVDFVLLPWS